MAAPSVADLATHVDKKGAFGLNEIKGTGVSALLNGGIARSDVDAQMIMFFPFSQSVKLSALVLDAPADEAPSEIKL